MFSRTAACRGVQRAARHHAVRPSQRRGLAAPASGSFQYQAGDANGVKFASRDYAGPTTTLALVAKAGTRYQPLPGLTEGLQHFAFRNTDRRSTLRIVREAELLGAHLTSYHTRENLVLEAKFLRDDLPYFVELFGDVITSTKYQPHVYLEDVLPMIHFAHKRFLANPLDMAINSAHSLAFHRGLGNPTSSSSSHPYTKYLEADTIEAFSKVAYAKPNFALVANGAEHGHLNKWVSEFFGGVPDESANHLGLPDTPGTEQTKYFGGEERIAHDKANTFVIAFPGSSSFTGKFYKPEIAVLASMLGGQSTIKWSNGFSLLGNAKASASTQVKTKSAIYSDAGLLYTAITGSNATNVAETAYRTVELIKAIASGDEPVNQEFFRKAKAAAKFKELEYGQDLTAGLVLTGSGLVSNNAVYQIDEVAKAIDGVTEQALKSAAKSLLEQKASVSAVGDLHVLPFADEIGLKV